MKCRPCKSLYSLQLGILRNVQASDAGDEYSRPDTHSLTGSGVPHALGFIPNRFVKAGIQMDVRGELVTLDTAFQVVVNFPLPRIHARPIGRRLEGKGIQM